MGDRCNFIISHDSTAGKTVTQAVAGNLVLYSHWGGHDAPGRLAEALTAARKRWDDPAYGARIIVSQIVGNDWNDETGYGLSVGVICDNEHELLLVDFEQQVVRCEDRQATFAGYLAMTGEERAVFCGRQSEED